MKVFFLSQPDPRNIVVAVEDGSARASFRIYFTNNKRKNSRFDNYQILYVYLDQTFQESTPVNLMTDLFLTVERKSQYILEQGFADKERIEREIYNLK